MSVSLISTPAETLKIQKPHDVLDYNAAIDRAVAKAANARLNNKDNFQLKVTSVQFEGGSSTAIVKYDIWTRVSLSQRVKAILIIALVVLSFTILMPIVYIPEVDRALHDGLSEKTGSKEQIFKIATR